MEKSEINFTRQDVVDAARKYLGVPFQRGARSMQAMDCVGLLILVGRDLGLHIEETSKYFFDPIASEMPELIKNYVDAQSIPAPLTPLKVGRIAILRQSVYPMHTGIFAKDKQGKFTIINANMKARRVVEQNFDFYWKDKLLVTRDYPGVTN